MRRICCMVGMGLLIAATPTQAQIVFVDYFDAYGTGDCPTGDFVANQAAFEAVWPTASGCRAATVDNGYLSATTCTGFRGSSLPVNMKFDKNGGQRSVHDLTSDIATLYPGYNAIQGDNTKALVFRVYFDLGISGTGGSTASRKTNLWVELTAPDAIGQDDRAPTTDFIVQTDLVTPCDASVCVQTPPNPHNCIAFGVFAHLDPPVGTPGCTNCVNPRLTDQMAIFDGEQWWLLRSGFPTGSVGDDILVSKRRNYATISITSDKISVSMDSTDFGVKVKTDIPRKYTGSFNKVAMGGCIANPEYPGWIDIVSVEDGVPSTLDTSPHGACCLPDGDCDILTNSGCSDQHGVYHGDFSSCPAYCCPIPWANADRDNDVDVDDFGVFQECFTGSTPGPALSPLCTCLDKAADLGVIDGADFLQFLACVSGPEVPFVAADHPMCPE